MDSSMICSSVSATIQDTDFFNCGMLVMYQHNLIGFILNKLVSSKIPMSFKDIVDEASSVMHLLRKADGSLYSCNLVRSINSVLNSSKIFWKRKDEHNEEVYWFHEIKAKAMLHKMELKIKSKKVLNNLESISGKFAIDLSKGKGLETLTSLSHGRKKEKYAKSRKNKQTKSRSRMSSEDDKAKFTKVGYENTTKGIIQEPFDFTKRSDEYKKGFLDCFSIFQSYRSSNHSGQSNENLENSSSSVMLIDSMLKQINQLNEKVGQISTVMTKKQPENSNFNQGLSREANKSTDMPKYDENCHQSILPLLGKSNEEIALHSQLLGDFKEYMRVNAGINRNYGKGHQDY